MADRIKTQWGPYEDVGGGVQMRGSYPVMDDPFMDRRAMAQAALRKGRKRRRRKQPDPDLEALRQKNLAQTRVMNAVMEKLQPGNAAAGSGMIPFAALRPEVRQAQEAYQAGPYVGVPYYKLTPEEQEYLIRNLMTEEGLQYLPEVPESLQAEAFRKK
jgi:hypothetical protein